MMSYRPLVEAMLDENARWFTSDEICSLTRMEPQQARRHLVGLLEDDVVDRRGTGHNGQPYEWRHRRHATGAPEMRVLNANEKALVDVLRRSKTWVSTEGLAARTRVNQRWMTVLLRAVFAEGLVERRGSGHGEPFEWRLAPVKAAAS